jgi:hypothetical protein
VHIHPYQKGQNKTKKTQGEWRKKNRNETKTLNNLKWEEEGL